MHDRLAKTVRVQLGCQPLRRDRAVALLHPVAQQLGGRGTLLGERDTHPAGLAEAVTGGLGAGCGERVGVGRLIGGNSSTAPGSPRANSRTFAHFFRAFLGTAT